jgi:hypothetical protein
MLRPNPLCYEINTIIWLNELSTQLGRPVHLGSVPDRAWDELAEWGFDLIWLMGVWRRSRKGREIAQLAMELYPRYSAALPDWGLEDVVGSPYSIEAYEPDPLIGDWDDLEAARRKLNDRGIGLILDFVGNHTGLDHAWVREFPRYYVLGTREEFEAAPHAFVPLRDGGTTRYFAKGRDPFFPPWHDTVQLDHFNLETRAALIQQLRLLSHRCDGFRCDMAMLMLNNVFERTWGAVLREERPEREFWEEAVSACPDAIWIAEAYWDTEWRLQQLGFSYVYDKRLYDRILHGAASDLHSHLTAELSYQQGLARFLENHDEPRCADLLPGPRLRAASVLMTALPGLRLFHHGQFEGRRVQTPVQLRRTVDETPDNELRQFYRALVSIMQDTCSQGGEWRLETPLNAGDDSHGGLIAFTWRFRDRFKLIVANLSPRPSQARILPDCNLQEDRTYRFVDLLNRVEYWREGSELVEQGLFVLLEGYQCHLFETELR